MSNSVRYLIAQYTQDPFRREPRNVGVIARRGDETVVKFYGESAPGVIDGRRLRSLPNPDVYRQWVDFWRSLALGEAPLDRFVETRSINYQAIPAGEVTDAGDDPLEDVVGYLYSLLVSEGRLTEALGTTEAVIEQSVGALRRAVDEELTRLNILARDEDDLQIVRYPVRPTVPVRGSLEEPHIASFVQQNGTLFVIETVDFAAREKERAKDHAGLVSYMFEDLRESRGSAVQSICLVRARPEDLEYPSVRYGLSLVKSEADTVIDWLDENAKQQFLHERRRVAMAEI